MNVTRIEPWKLINLMHHDLDSMADQRTAAVEKAGDVRESADWVPAVDIVEEHEQFVLRADVPGVEASAIDVNMEKGVLSVSGERNAAQNDNPQGVRRLERSSGKFNRRFTLPKSANAEEISARSVNGILEVVIPKQPTIKARRITVESA